MENSSKAIICTFSYYYHMVNFGLIRVKKNNNF